MTLRGSGDLLRGAVQSSTASEHKGLLAKCALQNQVPDVLLYYIMIFIWAVSQTKEFKRIRDWMRTIWSVRPLSLDRPYPMTEDKIIIHALSPCMKVIVFLANPLARSLLFIPVTFVGAKFLALQTVPFALVMKAVALQLVLNFDEMMVASLALRKAVAQLTRARFMTPCHERTCIPYWYDGVGSMFFYIMIVQASAQVTIEVAVAGNEPQFKRQLSDPSCIRRPAAHTHSDVARDAAMAVLMLLPCQCVWVDGCLCFGSVGEESVFALFVLLASVCFHAFAFSFLSRGRLAVVAWYLHWRPVPSGSEASVSAQVLFVVGPPACQQRSFRLTTPTIKCGCQNWILLRKLVTSSPLVSFV
ncbi:unnamed protein product [Polarella glacialis]|uniref:Uncharacterized protein n=1 Tax=Polarella glacialis TaxID=89957 RepID=A0A813GZS6_POLGL|nr:unnamed protein product [Polarella glacialis]